MNECSAAASTKVDPRMLQHCRRRRKNSLRQRCGEA
jgi:hypothetical protein